MSAAPRLVEVRKDVLKQNDVVARALRARYRVAALVGDLATENDVVRLGRS